MTSGKRVLACMALPLCILGARAAATQPGFASPSIYAAGKFPWWMATADFNGDGNLDLAAANGGSESISVALGNGDGSFQAPVGYPTGIACAVNFVATGDFNHDGKPDLLTACWADNVVIVLPGRGDGTFGAAIVTQLPLDTLTGQTILETTVQPALGDFDGDGNPDVVLFLATVGSRSLTNAEAAMLHGNGDGTFAAPQPISAFAGMFAISFAAADFNGDGHLDLAAVVLNGSTGLPASLVIALGQGDGAFRVANSYPTAFGNNLIVGDINGDGLPDIVLVAGSPGAHATAGIGVFTGNGDGSFKDASTTDLPNENFVFGACLADLQGTGKPGIALAMISGVVNGSPGSGSSDIQWMAGNGDGTFQNPLPIAPLGQVAATYLVCGDFNRDGRPDLAFPLISALSTATLTGNSTNNILPGLQAQPAGTMEVLLNTTPPSTFTDANAAGFERGAMAQDSIVAAFGGGLASTTAQPPALTTTLGGVTVTVKDSAGTSRPAELFYVSPTQINYAMPAGTATGAASITIANGAASVTASQQIVSVLPGLFTVDGIAAANVETYRNGALTSAALAFQVTAAGAIAPQPIDVSAGQVFLLMYGTGIRHAESVTVNLGSLTGLPVAYAGAQGAYIGEDQINVLLPASLAGAGVIQVTLVADGQTSNPVQIQIQ